MVYSQFFSQDVSNVQADFRSSGYQFFCRISSRNRFQGLTDRRVNDSFLIGGADLLEFDNSVQDTIEYFRQNNVRCAILGHCIEDEVIGRFEKGLKGITAVYQMFSGAEFEMQIRCEAGGWAGGI